MDRALGLVALSMLVALACAAWARGMLRSFSARRRMRRAVRGERSAEALLSSHGYAIEGRQVGGLIALDVDGVPEHAAVRCDLVVTRGGRRFVAEVKTGVLAPRLDHAPTRRQLIEYLLAFDVDGVLLVEPEAGRVRTIVMRRAARSSVSPLSWALVGAMLGAIATVGWIALIR